MRMHPGVTAFTAALSAAFVAAFLGGCTSTLNAVRDPFVAPHKFQFLRCQDIANRLVAAKSREQELRTLMDRASAGVGGSAVNLFAYQPEYQTVTSDIEQLKDTAEEKNCPPAAEPPKADTNNTNKADTAKADAKK